MYYTEEQISRLRWDEEALVRPVVENGVTAVAAWNPMLRRQI
jgi:hypothetical protein